MNWLSEYRGSLKNIHAEEMLDVYFFRPIAFVIVKSFYSLPLTPNHYSLMSFVSGMASAYYFGNARFGLGAFFFFLFAVLDCCDGMQARMKKNGSEFGRFIDGLVDYSSNFACYVALAFGIGQAWPEVAGYPGHYLVILAGVSKALHSITYDHYLMEYLSYDRGDGGFVQKEIEDIRKKIEETKKIPNHSQMRLVILRVYLAFSSLQAGNEAKALKFNSKDYVKMNYRTIQLWGLIGPAWHIAFLILAFLFHRPTWFFSYAIIFGNIWLLIMFIYQQKIHHDLAAKRKVA